MFRIILSSILKLETNENNVLKYIIIKKLEYFGIRDITIDYYYCGPKYKCATCDPTGTSCLTCSDP